MTTGRINQVASLSRLERGQSTLRKWTSCQRQVVSTSARPSQTFHSFNDLDCCAVSLSGVRVRVSAVRNCEDLFFRHRPSVSLSDASSHQTRCLLSLGIPWAAAPRHHAPKGVGPRAVQAFPWARRLVGPNNSSRKPAERALGLRLGGVSVPTPPRWGVGALISSFYLFFSLHRPPGVHANSPKLKWRGIAKTSSPW
jgi:hypothetical protein